MAIYHMEVKPVSRSSGRSSVAAAAYRNGTELVDERTGLVHDYTRKQGVEYAEIIAPDRQPVDRQQLWNAAESREKRKDARTAREYEIALPSELDAEQRKALAVEFAELIADRHGVAVDVAIHAPGPGSDERNYHAHLLCTTREVSRTEGGAIQLGEKAKIEIGDKDRAKLGLGPAADEIKELREQWATLANEHLARAGREERIDHRSYKEQGIDLTPTQHLGPNVVAMERRGIATDRMAEHEEIRKQQAAEIINRPEILAEKITGMRATFTAHDVAKELNRYIDDPQQFQGIMARAMASNDLVQLAPKSPDGPAVYTTREMVDVERQMIKSARTLANPVASRGTHSVAAKLVDQAIEKAGTMSEEQANAVRHVCGKERLAVIVGDAGTGKSFSMRTAAAAWQAAGYNVRGAALAGKAADELQAGSGINSRTLASLEYAWKKGRDKLTPKDVLVIDEAGMVGSRQMGRVLAAAEKAGAKVVLLGDHKQLAAIESGAAFRAITERVGAAEITEVRRQSQKWMKEAGQELARGSVEKAVAAYQEHGLVKSAETREQARADLAKKYVADLEKGGSCIVLSHTNKDVTALNESIRDERKGKGELANGVTVETERGPREFAEGDRLVFLKNDKDLGVKNGTLATVEKADAGKLHVRLDDGTTRDVDLNDYKNIEHGYAVTVHKAQGVTVDRAYLLATPSMDRSLAYVGMTRHRHECEIYHGQDDFKSPTDMTRAMSRADNKTSTLDYLESRGEQHGERGLRGQRERSIERDPERHGIRAARERAAELAISPGEIEAADMDCVRELHARDLAIDEHDMGGILRDHAHASGQQREQQQERAALPGDETMARPAQREPERRVEQQAEAKRPREQEQAKREQEQAAERAPIYAEQARQEREPEARTQNQPAKEKSATQMSDEEFAAHLDAIEARQEREQEMVREPEIEQPSQEKHAPESPRIDDLDLGATHIAPQPEPVQEREPEARTHEPSSQEKSFEERWEYERKAVDAVDQRKNLIDNERVKVQRERKEALVEARQTAEQALEDMPKRPMVLMGVGKEKAAAWDKEKLARERTLEQAEAAERQWHHYPDQKWIKAQATERVDKANPELAALARDGEKILDQEKRQQQAENLARVRERARELSRDRDHERGRGGRSR